MKPTITRQHLTGMNAPNIPADRAARRPLAHGEGLLCEGSITAKMVLYDDGGCIKLSRRSIEPILQQSSSQPLPSRPLTAALTAALLAFGLTFPAAAQNSAQSWDRIDGPPPNSIVIDVPRGMPDGNIGFAPDQAATSGNQPAPLAPRTRPELEATALAKPVHPAAKPPSQASSSIAQLSKKVAAEATVASSSPIIVSQIHNAPGWQHNHDYHYTVGPFTRVVNGPGWGEENSGYIPGQVLNAYQLISAGSCTSAARGGPTGTGSNITDGTCTWKYLSPVDYISITGWAFDSHRWKSETTYHYFDYVTSGSPLRAYALADDSCASSIAPAGNGGVPDGEGKKFKTSDGCQWYYKADILYSSEKSYIPTVTLTSSKSPATIQVKANYEAMLWNDREYVAGQNGESSPIILLDKAGNRHGGGEGGALLGCDAPAPGGARSGRCYRFTITTAPGESFIDSLTTCEAFSGFDPRKGVAIYNPQPYQWPYEPAGLFAGDPFVNIIGLQLKSIHGAAFYGFNEDTIRNSILDGGSSDQWTSNAAVWLDAGPNVVANSLVISHGPVGIVFKYPGIVLHDTIVNSDRSVNSVGIETGNKWVYNDTIVADTAIFGFTHAGASGNNATSFASQSSNNVTDAPVNDSGNATWMGAVGNYPVDVIPGTTYGSLMSSAFVKPGSDWRPKSGGTLVGKGSAFGSFGTFCNLPQGNSCSNYMTFNFDSPDIVGTSRPQDGHYDIGAWQSPAAMPNEQSARCTSRLPSPDARP